MRPDLFACFRNEDAAIRLVESYVWPTGAICPHCGESERTGELHGRSTPTGTRKCYSCRRLFSVRSTTIFEFSHVPLHKWLEALFLTNFGTEPIKPFQLSQAINVSFKTAVQMLERITRSAEECGLQSREASIGDVQEN
jgi:transposase-like protein